MELRLERRPATDDAIMGTLFVDGLFEGFTLEHLGYEIPLGRYAVSVTYSQRFHRMLPLITVPGRAGIRIHSGNFPSDSTGCILIGQEHTVSSVGHSQLALAALQPKIAGALARGQQVYLAVLNAPTASTVNV